jgi:two-component system response regulator YesN
MDATKSYLAKREDCYVFSDITGKVVVLFNSDGNIIPCCQQLKAYLDNLLKCTVSIGIGKEYLEINSVRSSYYQAADALKCKCVLGGDNVICYSEFEVPRKDCPDYSFDAEDFMFRLNSGLEKEAISSVKMLIDQIGRTDPKHSNALIIIGSEIVSCLQKTCLETGIDIMTLTVDGRHPYERILLIHNEAEMSDYLCMLVSLFIEKRLAMQNVIQSDTVNALINYINDNITDYTLSLTSVADHFRMNPSYISRLFKQKMACNFCKYITSVRIDRSVGLIKGGNRKVNEIAELVGFIDPHYFGVCFRKLKGMSVTDYIKASLPDTSP